MDVHRAEVARQVVEWRRLRELFAGVPLVVEGYFNHARSGARWSYGTDAARQAVTMALPKRVSYVSPKSTWHPLEWFSRGRM